MLWFSFYLGLNFILFQTDYHTLSCSKTKGSSFTFTFFIGFPVPKINIKSDFKGRGTVKEKTGGGEGRESWAALIFLCYNTVKKYTFVFFLRGRGNEPDMSTFKRI